MKGLTSNSNVSQLIKWLNEGKTVLYGLIRIIKIKIGRFEIL